MHVKEKKVKLIELFYDLIYVYAISRLTLLIEEPEGGIIPLPGFFRYLVISNRKELGHDYENRENDFSVLPRIGFGSFILRMRETAGIR